MEGKAPAMVRVQGPALPCEGEFEHGIRAVF